MVLESSNLAQNSGLSSYDNCIKPNNSVKSLPKDNLKTVEVEGIEPSDSWMISQNPRQVTPTADSLYQDENKN